MKARVAKSEIGGSVAAPASKSYTIRGLMCAALAKGGSELVNPLDSDDTSAAADVLDKIGVKVLREEGIWKVTGGSFSPPDSELYCADSAATLRFMTAICSIVPGECRLTAGESLSRRPVQPLVDALSKLGVNITCEAGYPPVTVSGGVIRKKETEIRGDISSQFITALLLVAPLAERGMKIRLTKPLESRAYVMMTLLTLRKFGIEISRALDSFVAERQTYQPARYEVEGDWTSASYFLALGALAGDIEVSNLNSASWQGDKVMMELLRDMGARVEVIGSSIKVYHSRLKPVKANLSESIDLLPTVAVLAAAAEGDSELTGIERARIKESDRVSAMAEGLRNMGVNVVVEGDSMKISGGAPHGAEIDSRADHRIAMAFATLGITVGDTVINGAECVSKTYPQFWKALKGIGGEVSLDE